MYISLPQGGTMLILNIEDLEKVKNNAQSAHKYNIYYIL